MKPRSGGDLVRSPMRFFRWLLVVPVLLGSVYAAFITGFHLMRLSDWLCRSLGFSEALCLVTWYPAAETIVASLGAIVAVLLGVLLPTAVAPTGAMAVAIACALVSLALSLAIIVLLGFPLLVPALSAALVAVLTTRFLARRRSPGRAGV